MTKQEFLAFSLPYGLKTINVNYIEEDILIIRNFLSIDFNGNIKVDGIVMPLNCNITAHKPILRPLSDLTKEIEHNGEKFVPMVKLAEICRVTIKTSAEWRVYSNTNDIVVFADDNYFKYNQIGVSFSHIIRGRRAPHIKTVFNQMELILKLIKWHFDIAGLIEKGEAIDVNTLPENPYK